ncbi:hypothetical protein ACCY16_02065 [Candidatus Pantoea formicae]|uniref:hypothetical protein n=1 Tax=Candidatus Pantoea formicae TaxID=2608355 RepID=UPI003ED87AAE
MWSVILKLLKAEWASLLVIVALVGAGIWFGTHMTAGQLSDQKASYEQQLRDQASDFDKQRLQWQDERTGWEKERTAASDKHAADLKAALKQRDDAQAKADALSVQLAQNESDSARRVNDLKRRLKDALKSDGTAYTGLGPAGLQLWREALGWSASGDVGNTAGNGLSEASGSIASGAGNAASTGGGLSASGIISNSAEYGKWCLNLRDRLQTLKNYYR